MDAAEKPKPSFLEGILDLMRDVPSEFMDAFTKMRELDLLVENGKDVQKKRIREFFQKAKNLSAEEREQLFKFIKEAFETIIEDADAKIDLADALHKELKTYLGKLDENIQEVKEDLEREVPGITDAIEQKVAAKMLHTQNDAPPQKKNAKKKVAKKKKW